MGISQPFVAGEVVDATDLNGFLSAWEAYTPVVTNFAVGNGTLTGRYYRQGKTIALRINFVAGSGSSYTGDAAALSLPVAAHAVGEQWLPLKLFTGSGNFQGHFFIPAGGATAQLYVPTSGGGNGSTTAMSSGQPNPGTGGNLTIQGVYEAA